ncbi:tumor necrosis factor ligand superfamily member 13-like [Lissotriton helveticus]
MTRPALRTRVSCPELRCAPRWGRGLSVRLAGRAAARVAGMKPPHRTEHAPRPHGGRAPQQALLLAASLAALSISAVLWRQAAGLQEEVRRLGQSLRKGHSSVRSPRPPAVHARDEQHLLMGNSYLPNTSLQALLRGRRGNRRSRRDTENCTSQQSFIQLVPAKSQPLLQQGDSTLIPWTVALRQGQVLEVRNNRLVIEEDSYYLVFGQVLYQENGLPMGHLIQRRKQVVAGTDLKILLRCIKNMPELNSNNSCYTAGVVKLEQGDELELVIADRPQAQISLDGDSTFFGAIQLL